MRAPIARLSWPPFGRWLMLKPRALVVSLIDNRLRSPSRTSRWEPTTAAPLRHRIVSRFYSYFSARFGTEREKDKRAGSSPSIPRHGTHTSGSRLFALSTDSRGNSWIRPPGDRWCVRALGRSSN